MPPFKNLKKHGIKLLFCGVIALAAVLGGAKLSSEAASTHAAAPQPHLQACGGWAFPPCE